MAAIGRHLRVILALGLSSVGGFGAIDPQAQPVIETARAVIGSEDVLRAVDSVRFVGRLETFADNSTKPIELVLRKPGLVWMRVGTEDQAIEMGIDDYEGWRKVIANGKVRTASIPVASFWETRFGSIDNLYFFHAVDVVYGEATFAGMSSFEGQAVQLVDFRYNEANQYRRGFSTETGELLFSRRKGSDTQTVERAHGRFDGILFATEIEQYQGEERVSRMVFTQIEVNPEVDPAIFRYPLD